MPGCCRSVGVVLRGHDGVVTNQLVKEVISLPMHTELDDEQINFITKTVLEFVNG